MGYIKYAIAITVGIVISILGVAAGIYKYPTRCRIDEDELYQRREPIPEHQGMEV